jgi:flagellar protein FlbD
MGDYMVELTKLSGEKIVINCELVEYIDANPDTTINLTTNNIFIVKESVDEVIEKIVAFKKEIFSSGKIRFSDTKEEE